MRKGLVIKSTGSWYNVLFEDRTTMPCRIVGKFRLNGKSLTNPVAVGDEVQVEKEVKEDVGNIVKILPRKNYIVRQSPRKKHYLHLIASNVDQAVVVMTIIEPMLKQGFIDRFILMAESHKVPCIVVFNKLDVYGEDEMLMANYFKKMYEDIGYPTHIVSALRGDGIDELREVMLNKTTLVSGQSGVGKSTLLNAILPELELRTFELSEASGKGQHTTTFVQMYTRDEDQSRIIDTPGIKNLSFNNLEPTDVAHNFVEFFTASKDCKFDDCSHINEPKCAVKDGLEDGSISELRYGNYLKIVAEIEDQNYWERHS